MAETLRSQPPDELIDKPREEGKHPCLPPEEALEQDPGEVFDKAQGKARGDQSFDPVDQVDKQGGQARQGPEGHLAILLGEQDDPLSQDLKDSLRQDLKGLFFEEASDGGNPAQETVIVFRSQRAVISYLAQKAGEADPAQKAADEAARGLQRMANLHMIIWHIPPNIIRTLSDEKCLELAKAAYGSILGYLPYSDSDNLLFIYRLHLQSILDIANDSKQAIQSACPDLYGELQRQVDVVGQEIAFRRQDGDIRTKHENGIKRAYALAENIISAAIDAILRHRDDRLRPRLVVDRGGQKKYHSLAEEHKKYPKDYHLREKKAKALEELAETVKVENKPWSLGALGISHDELWRAFYTMEVTGPLIPISRERMLGDLYGYASIIADSFPRLRVAGGPEEKYHILARKYKERIKKSKETDPSQ